MANRQHLFRGKRKDNGEWIEGHLFATVDNTYIAYVNQFDDDLFLGTKNIFISIIPETVCEWTGLEDKNGVKIFEDDIVKTKEYGKVIGYSNVNDYDVFKIVYAPAFFRLENKDREFLLGEYSKHLEVIGNIHDNPELLEV